MRGLFFNAQPTTDVTTHPSGFDREYDVDDFNHYMGLFFTNGVFVRDDPDACKVIKAGAIILFRPGIVLVDGSQCHIESTDRVIVKPISTTTTTWTSIMCRRNNSADVRGFELIAVSALDDYPAPVRDGDIYDMCLAHLDVEPDGAISWMEDIRNDSEVCGFAALTGQPPYYPPDEANLPYTMWLYTLGFPMTAQQKAAVEGNPSLMAIYGNKNFYDKKETVSLASGSCATPASTSAKTTGIVNFNLISGACVSVKFTYSNTAASPTLNVNGTGAKPIYHCMTGTYITSADIVAGMTAYLSYNGTQWVLLNPASGMSYVTGSYTADNTANRTISLGFKPSAVFVFRTSYSVANGGIEPISISMATAGLAGNGLSIVTGGFMVSNTTGGLNIGTSATLNYVALR